MRPIWVKIALILVCGLVQANCREGYSVPIIPLGYASNTSKEGVQSGFYVELYREVARRAQCKLVLEPLPAQRARAVVSLRRTAMIAPTGAPESTTGIIFIPMAFDSMELVVREGLNLQQWDEVAGKPNLVFGTIRGASYGTWVNQFLATLPAERLDISIDAETVYRKLDAGRIDATFGNAYVYRWYLDSIRSRGNVKVIPVPAMRRMPIGVMMTPAAMAAEDVEPLRKAFEAVRDDGSFRRMMASYLGEEAARERVYVAPKGSR